MLWIMRNSRFLVDTGLQDAHAGLRMREIGIHVVCAYTNLRNQKVSCRHRFAGSVNWRRFNALNGKDEADGSLLWSTTGHSHGIQVWRDAPITATLSIARQPWGSRSFKRAVLWVGLSGSTKDQVVFLRVFALFELTLWYLFTQQNEKWFVQALR